MFLHIDVFLSLSPSSLGNLKKKKVDAPNIFMNKLGFLMWTHVSRVPEIITRHPLQKLLYKFHFALKWGICNLNKRCKIKVGPIIV